MLPNQHCVIRIVKGITFKQLRQIIPTFYVRKFIQLLAVLIVFRFTKYFVVYADISTTVTDVFTSKIVRCKLYYFEKIKMYRFKYLSWIKWLSLVWGSLINLGFLMFCYLNKKFFVEL